MKLSLIALVALAACSQAQPTPTPPPQQAAVGCYAVECKWTPVSPGNVTGDAECLPGFAPAPFMFGTAANRVLTVCGCCPDGSSGPKVQKKPASEK